MKEERKKFLLYTLGAAVIAILYLALKYMRIDKNNFVELFNFKTTLVLLVMVFIFALVVILFVSEEKYKDTKLSLIAILIFALIFAAISYFRYTQITGATSLEMQSIKASLLKQLAFFAVYIFAFFGSFVMLKKNEEMTEVEDSKKKTKKKNKKK